MTFARTFRRSASGLATILCLTCAPAAAQNQPESPPPEIHAVRALRPPVQHVQEPPPEQIRGTPRLAITVTPGQVDKAVEVFQRRDIPFEDVHHPATSPISRSLYFKDPSSNFLELCCERSAENET